MKAWSVWLQHPLAAVVLRGLGAVAITLFAWWLSGRLHVLLNLASSAVERRLLARARRVRELSQISEPAVEVTIETTRALVRVVVLAALFYGWLLAVTYVIDESHEYVWWVIDPLRQSAHAGLLSVRAFLPNIVILVLIIAVGRIAQSVIVAFTRGIALGRVTALGLDRALSTPTHRVLTFVLWVSMVILAAPYLPGSDSKAFQAVSVMLGVLVSLGSSSFISNIIAGLVLTYSRAYRVGDRVRIGELYGDVTVLGSITTRIRTIKDEEVIVPNSVAHGAAIVNYSRFAHSTGVQASAQVTIGYEAPYAIVEALLIKAALSTPNVVADPLPYVLQPALEDYYVRYEICAYTRLPNQLHLTEAELRRKIQDTFFAAGVEICSPAYMSLRDGSAAAIPPQTQKDAAAPVRD